mmetsp:Transcript_28453/g.41538  ORF Transcript_28453/g.41538 Transcript_28453/m.41538 type:complete len:249 (-) Transcript_28453:109-855(-)
MNIGWFSLWSRAHGHSVIAFDPHPIMHARVCESLALNQWDHDGSVRLFPYGLGGEESITNLTTGKNPGGSSFFEDRLAKKYRSSFPVRVVTLDGIAEQEGWLDPTANAMATTKPIHLMKVDVEGFEYFTLKGGEKLLASGKVSNIIMENSSTDGKLVPSLFALLYQSGYKVHALLSVNGDPYHNDKETIDGVNRAIAFISSKENVNENIDLDSNADASNLKWLVKVTCNMWWIKRGQQDSDSSSVSVK